MAGSEVTQKLHEETWNAASNLCRQSVQALCGRPNIVFENFNDVLTWKSVSFEKTFRFLLHNTRDVTRGQRGTISRAPNRYMGAKSRSNVITTFFKTVGLHLLPKDPRFEHRGAKLVSFPRRHLTSLCSCTSRLSSQNDEICLQKYLPISGKLSITNYLKQNAVDYRSHLTIENNLKVEKKVYYFENRHNFHSPQKNAWGARRDEHNKKLESNNYAGTSSGKVFIASQGLIHSIFCTKCDYIAVTKF